MPLKIVVAGAGIAGLITAISLRRASHNVTVLEKYDTGSVVGAALNVHPNGMRVLDRLGFDEVRAKACRPTRFAILREADLQQLNSIPLATSPTARPGGITVHRNDLHQELLRIGTTDSEAEEGWGAPIEIRGKAAVARVSDDGRAVILESGEEVEGDLIVGADGVDSVIRDYVVQDLRKPIHSGMAAFRFLVDSERLRADTELKSLLETGSDAVNMVPDTANMDVERHMIWYGCRNGEVQNVIGIHPSDSANVEEGTEELKTTMKTEFAHFDPKIEKIIELSAQMKRWPLYFRDPLARWYRGRVVLVGDAAHPMLPFSGTRALDSQGSAQAMEDGAALGLLLKGQTIDSVAKSLATFEQVRSNRAARVQIISSARAGRESDVADKIGPYLDETAPRAPASIMDRRLHDFAYDIHAACAKAIEA